MTATRDSYEELRISAQFDASAQHPDLQDIEPGGRELLCAVPFEKIAVLFPKPVLAILPLFVVVALLALLVLFGGGSDTLSSSSGCDPNGNVHLPNAGIPGIWSTDWFLAITLGFGNYSYSTAKAIDIVWDILVGRVGQAIAAALVYFVFSKSLLFSMEHTPARYEKFVAMAYTPTTFSALLTYTAWNPWRKWRPLQLRQCLTGLALVFTTIYVLAFPTLAAAMTGYQTLSSAMLPTSNGTLFAIYHLNNTDTNVWSFDGVDYTEEYILSQGVCQPEKTYQWGFSFLFLFVVLVFTIVVGAMLCAVWFDTHGFIDSTGDPLGSFRAALLIAAAIKQELGDEAERMTNKELKRELTRRKALMSMSGLGNLQESSISDVELKPLPALPTRGILSKDSLFRAMRGL